MIKYTVEMYLALKSVNESAVSLSQSGALPQKTYKVILNHNETSILPLDLSVPNDGNYRMDILLFNETVVGQDITGLNRVNASYRNLQLGINVTSPLALKSTIEIR